MSIVPLLCWLNYQSCRTKPRGGNQLTGVSCAFDRLLHWPRLLAQAKLLHVLSAWQAAQKAVCIGYVLGGPGNVANE
jgi:hypothetical protein